MTLTTELLGLQKTGPKVREALIRAESIKTTPDGGTPRVMGDGEHWMVGTVTQACPEITTVKFYGKKKKKKNKNKNKKKDLPKMAGMNQMSKIIDKQSALLVLNKNMHGALIS